MSCCHSIPILLLVLLLWNFLVRHTIALSLAILTATGNRRVPRILSIKYVVSVDRITWRLPPPPTPHSFCDDRVKSLCDAAYYESLLFLVIHGPQSRCWHQSRQKQMRGWSEGDISVSIVRWLTDRWLRWGIPLPSSSPVSGSYRRQRDDDGIMHFE